jgi:Zn-dependent protease with chaperone function
VPARDTQRQLIENDIARVRLVVDVPEDVRFQVMNCEADGFVHQGRTVVLSTRLSRMNPSQRFFIVAHEMGHVQLHHHGAMRSFVADIVKDQTDEGRAKAQLVSALASISHDHEFAADTFAVQAMRKAGIDPEQAALIFDSIPDGRDNATHPSARRRAASIREEGRRPLAEVVRPASASAS